MGHHLRNLPDVLTDLTPEVRSVWLAFGIAIVLLLGVLTWFGLDQSSPIRAAEAAVRERLNRPHAEIDSRLHYYPDLPPFRARSVLVCGRIDGSSAYGALVQKRRRGGAMSLIGSGDRILTLAIGGAPGQTARQTLVLDACAKRG